MSYFGLHLQTPIAEWESELQRAANADRPYRIVKAFWVEVGKTAKAISQSTTTVFRRWVEHQQPYLDRAIISSDEADAAADEVILHFSDSINYHGQVDYVESLNETYPSKDLLAQQKAVAFDRAFIRRLKVLCPNTRPVVYTAPPGNIDHDEYAVLVPLAIECEAAGGAFGYHNYWSVVNKNSYVNSPAHARDYHMRWSETLDMYLVARGIRVNYILGESGAIGAGSTGYWQKPDDGWLKDDVWNGDQDGYISDLVSMDALFASSLAGRENRLLGATLFTSGQGVGWDHFQIQMPFLARLTDYITDSDIYTPPAPLPLPPSTDFSKKAWEITVQMQETGQDGIRLNADAAIQQQINADNNFGNYDLQIVTAETIVDGKTVQAAESMTDKVARRVYVWEAGVPIYWYEEG